MTSDLGGSPCETSKISDLQSVLSTHTLVRQLVTFAKCRPQSFN